MDTPHTNAVPEFDYEFTKATNLTDFELDQATNAALLLHVGIDDLYAGSAFNTDAVNELMYSLENVPYDEQLDDVRLYKFKDSYVVIENERIGLFCTHDVGLLILSTFGS